MTTAQSHETAQKTVALTVRLPVELADALRNYAFVTNASANDVMKRALLDYLQAGGRAEMVRQAFEQVLNQHAVALDKLKDM
jgi:predicted transcriptional regulator